MVGRTTIRLGNATTTGRSGANMTRFRWVVADLINRRQGQRWADLVLWASGLSDSRIPWCPITDTCRLDAARNGACYCGKLGTGHMTDGTG